MERGEMEKLLAIEGIGQVLGGIYAPLSSLLVRILEIRKLEDLKEQVKKGKEIVKEFADGRRMEFIELEDGRLIPKDTAFLLKKTDPRFLSREQIAEIQRNIMTSSEWDMAIRAENENIQRQQALQNDFGEFLGLAFDDPNLLQLGVQIFSLASQMNNPFLFRSFLENLKRKQIMQFELMRQQQVEEQQRKKRR